MFIILYFWALSSGDCYQQGQINKIWEQLVRRHFLSAIYTILSGYMYMLAVSITVAFAVVVVVVVSVVCWSLRQLLWLSPRPNLTLLWTVDFAIYTIFLEFFSPTGRTLGRSLFPSCALSLYFFAFIYHHISCIYRTFHQQLSLLLFLFFFVFLCHLRAAVVVVVVVVDCRPTFGNCQTISHFSAGGSGTNSNKCILQLSRPTLVGPKLHVASVRVRMGVCANVCMRILYLYLYLWLKKTTSQPGRHSPFAIRSWHLAFTRITFCSSQLPLENAFPNNPWPLLSPLPPLACYPLLLAGISLPPSLPLSFSCCPRWLAITLDVRVGMNFIASHAITQML